MQIRPNKTVIRGRVSNCRRDPTGFGGEVDVEVLENLSPSPDDDFLRPEPGRTLTVFTTEPHKANAGDLVEIEANLLGGPFGERAVVRHVTKL